MFLAIGMELEDCIFSVTAKPAEVIGKADEMGSLKVWAKGDTVVLSIDEGNFVFEDHRADNLSCSRRLTSVHTIINGALWRKRSVKPLGLRSR